MPRRSGCPESIKGVSSGLLLLEVLRTASVTCRQAHAVRGPLAEGLDDRHADVPAKKAGRAARSWRCVDLNPARSVGGLHRHQLIKGEFGERPLKQCFQRIVVERVVGESSFMRESVRGPAGPRASTWSAGAAGVQAQRQVLSCWTRHRGRCAGQPDERQREPMGDRTDLTRDRSGDSPVQDCNTAPRRTRTHSRAGRIVF